MTAVLALALLGSPGAALAQGAPPPIVAGQTTSDWPAVGVLAAVDEAGGVGAEFCSGTLVDDTLVATAAHCVDAAELYQASGMAIYFGVGPSVDALTDAVRARSFDVHPDYVFDGSGIAADVAVMELETAPAGVEPLPVYTETFDAAFVRGDLTLVGYGITGDGRTDSGTKRTATLPIYQLDGDFIYAVDTSDPGGSNACSGDSGGAALVKVDGAWQLAGVLSFVFAFHDASSYCDGGGVGAVRMDVFGPWVLDGTDGADQDDGGGTPGVDDGGEDDGGGTTAASNVFGEDPGACSAVPAAPAALPALIVGLLAVGRRRR